MWIIDFVKIRTNGEEEIIKKHKAAPRGLTKQQRELELNSIKADMINKMDELTNENCLNIMVTSYFLQLYWVYEKVWHEFFAPNFTDVINDCGISLSNINPVIVRHIAERIDDVILE